MSLAPPPEPWHNRNWDPSEEERDRVSYLFEVEAGQILLRMLDQAAELEMLRWESVEGDLAHDDMMVCQGKARAFREVKMWLTRPPEVEEAPSETEEVLS